MTQDTFRRLDTSGGGRREAFELLHLLLLGEAVYPSDEIWLVARDLPDIDLFDNRSVRVEAGLGEAKAAQRAIERLPGSEPPLAHLGRAGSTSFLSR